MRGMHIRLNLRARPALVWAIFVAAAMSLVACRKTLNEAPPIVGAWVVNIPGAPFPMHMFIFHADGTVVQPNPDAGDAASSDSNLMGAWVREGEGFRARMVEFHADRESHKLKSHAEIVFHLKVSGDVLSGTADAVIYDPADHTEGEPIHVTMTGKRVTL